MSEQNKSFSFVKNDARQTTMADVRQIMTYELGKVVEYAYKAGLYGEDGYYSDANQQKEMADLISMVRMYCELKGWDYDVLETLGETAYLERQSDLKQHGLQRKEDNV